MAVRLRELIIGLWLDDPQVYLTANISEKMQALPIMGRA